MTDTVDLSRYQALLLAVLTFVPVPLLTLGGLAVPFPELAQRALAPMLPFVDVPGEAEGASFQGTSVHALGIQPAVNESLAGGPATAPRSVVLTSVSGIGSIGTTNRASSAAQPARIPVSESSSAEGSAAGPEVFTGEGESTPSGDNGSTDDSGDGGSSTGGDASGSSGGTSGSSGSGGSGSSGSGSSGSGSGSGSGTGALGDVVTDPPVVTGPEIPPVADPPVDPTVPGVGNGNGNGNSGSGNGNSGSGNGNSGSGNGNSGGSNAGGNGNGNGSGKGKTKDDALGLP